MTFIRRFPLLLLVLLCGCSNDQRQPSRSTAPAAAPSVKITTFYASAPEIARGEPTLICYGVENAAKVRMVPPVEGVWPSPNRCVQVSPERDTTYTLTATAADGKQTEQTVSVKVRKRAAANAAAGRVELIVSFLSTATQINAGMPVTICYEVALGATAHLEPSPQPVSGDKQCVNVQPRQTTTYTLTAASGGRKERREITIRVQ